MDKKILIVEDNKDLSEMFELVFKKEGFDTRVSSDGSDALVEVSSFEPDLVLLDIMMPGVNGFDFLKELREERESLSKEPIIIINSNLGEDKNMLKGFELGSDYYLKKADYTPYQVVDKVKEILELQEIGS